METTPPLRLPDQSDFRIFLQGELARRCGSNPRYSLRAFAKFLEVSPSFLSHLLNGRRPVTQSTLTKFSKKIGLEFTQVQLFKEWHFGKDRSIETQEMVDIHQLTLDQFQIISDWYHYAILELLLVDAFEASPRWVAKVLDISVPEVNQAVERLVRLGLLEIRKKGKWIGTGNHTTVGNEFTAVAFRKLQKQILTRAVDALENIPMEERDQSSLTLALDADLMPELKSCIKQFRKKILEFQEMSTKKNRVYQLSISVYPITDKLSKGKK